MGMTAGVVIDTGAPELIQGLALRLLEQRAQLTDRVMYDRLLLDMLTRYAQAERDLRALNDVKNRFLGMAAHDLRNPLSALRGMAELLVETDLDAEQRQELLREMHRAANDMLRLVNDLLDVAVIESGKLDLRLVPTNLSALVAARVALVKPLAGRKQMDVLVDDQGDVQCSLDADRCAQVIDNLLTNAIKFAKPGTPVRVAVRSMSDAVEFEVSDRGPGIAPQDRPKLFGTFTKLSARPTAGEQSSGLGLAIVKKMVDAHSGTITVDDAPGGGARFTVRFPLHGAA